MVPADGVHAEYFYLDDDEPFAIWVGTPVGGGEYIDKYLVPPEVLDDHGRVLSCGMLDAAAAGPQVFVDCSTGRSLRRPIVMGWSQKVWKQHNRIGRGEPHLEFRKFWVERWEQYGDVDIIDYWHPTRGSYRSSTAPRNGKPARPDKILYFDDEFIATPNSSQRRSDFGVAPAQPQPSLAAGLLEEVHWLMALLLWFHPNGTIGHPDVAESYLSDFDAYPRVRRQFETLKARDARVAAIQAPKARRRPWWRASDPRQP